MWRRCSHSLNLEAQEAYMKGLFYFARGWERFFVHAEGQQALHTSNEYFQRAISIDPQYAQAYAGLARSYLWLSDVDGPKAEAGAKAAADKAIALNETLAEPHMVRGFLLLDGDPDWAGAEREFLRSIELNPSYAEAHHGYAIYLSSLGRFDEATAGQTARSRSIHSLVLQSRRSLGSTFVPDLRLRYCPPSELRRTVSG